MIMDISMVVESRIAQKIPIIIVNVIPLFKKMMVLPLKAENMMLNTLIDSTVVMERWQRGKNL